MRVKLLLFGSIRDAVNGCREMIWELDENDDTRTLFRSVVSKYPALIQLGTLAIAVNKKYITESVELHDGDEVAFLPPMSGG